MSRDRPPAGQRLQTTRRVRPLLRSRPERLGLSSTARSDWITQRPPIGFHRSRLDEAAAGACWEFFLNHPEVPPRCENKMLQNIRLIRSATRGLYPAFCGVQVTRHRQPRFYASAAERKKFYEHVSITHGEAGFEINLDRRKLKTPQGKLFSVPNEALAIAVATEWDSQCDSIKFYTMHLTTLCNTALDNPTLRKKEQLIKASVKFLETDTVCYRVEEPPGLVELQRNEWDPVIEWAEKRYNVMIGSSTSILGPSIPKETKEVFGRHLASYNTWALLGIEFIVSQLKSLILSMGLLDRSLTVEKAVLLSRLEEEYQIHHWGNVEWAHEYDLHELSARTAAGLLFVHLCSESSTVKHKLLQD
ncbi:ATP synthase mitochondrial F1 complex assembly factor 2 [Pelodytes ibericus]